MLCIKHRVEIVSQPCARDKVLRNMVLLKADGVYAFIARTQADELMITSQIFDHAARLRSYEIVANLHENFVIA